MKRKKIILLSIIAVLLLPFWMWMAWWLTPKRKLTVAIVDKTVLDRSGQEHISFDWVLNQQRFTKNRRALYSPDHDYFGFFPGSDDHYRIKGLERMGVDRLQQLASDADMAYFTDTYGVEFQKTASQGNVTRLPERSNVCPSDNEPPVRSDQEWYKKVPDNERSEILYGGMSMQDIEFLKEMKARHKLMIAEFNAIGSPTQADVRHQFEDLFGLHWSGWTVRYFSSLDTAINRELPHWLTGQYRQQHGGAWPFHKDGIVWVNNAGGIVILENVTDLVSPLPEIAARQAGLQDLDLPAFAKYPFWFDVIDEDTARGEAGPNEVAAEFVIHANARGEDLLRQNHIPVRCPAVLRHKGPDYGFYYFSGDFCDNPLSFGTSYFKGIGWFKGLFYNDNDAGERKSFFWNFYRPMMTRILEDEYKHISSGH